MPRPGSERPGYSAAPLVGTFCRPVCTVNEPLPQTARSFASADEALAAGYRPCPHCQPLDVREIAPSWIGDLLEAADRAPHRLWSNQELQEMGVDPTHLRDWFKQHRGISFHAFVRARRLGFALGATAGGSSARRASGRPYALRDAPTLRTQVRHDGAATPLLFAALSTPLGPVIAAAEERGVVLLEFVDRPALPAEVEELRFRYGYLPAAGRHRYLDLLERELRGYFAGELQRFTVPLVTPGTAFQQRVWHELCRLPYGTTTSYGALARRLDCASSRAVGRANGQNRISIVVPCHRVLGADGDLTGYGGGQPRKAFLLGREGAPFRRAGSTAAAAQAALF